MLDILAHFELVGVSEILREGQRTILRATKSMQNSWQEWRDLTLFCFTVLSIDNIQREWI